MKNLINFAAPYWKNLPEDKKYEYKEKAKNENYSLDSSEFSVSDLIQNEDENMSKKKDEIKKQTRIDIQQMIENSIDLNNMVVYIISTSTFYENVDIYPAELAMSKFSLRDGIFDFFSVHINPGELPIGSFRSVIEKSQKTHKYPHPNRQENIGEKNYINILQSILNFLSPLDDIPIFFTEGTNPNENDILESTRRVMMKIFEESGEFSVAKQLKIYSITDLLFYLRNYITRQNKMKDPSCDETKFRSEISADEEFKKQESVLQFVTNGCNHHKTLDVTVDCCLSKVKRFGYVLAKFCSDKTQYPLIQGRHYADGYKLS